MLRWFVLSEIRGLPWPLTMAKKSCSSGKDGDLRVGDRVSYSIGLSVFHGVVIEDRGHLGVGGRQIVRIEIRPSNPDEGEVRRTEFPAEFLVRETPAA
jgi:hypothetical protein